MPQSHWSQEKYIEAWRVASAAHQGQLYAGAVAGQYMDYIHHVGAVAMELMWVCQHGQIADADLAIQCALLHDVLEDTEYAYVQLHAAFGQKVAEGVLALTKSSGLSSKQAQMLDSLTRIQQQPTEIWMVKLADRITNLSPPPFTWSAEKCAAYRDEAILILKELGSANALLAQRLQDHIDAYQKYCV